MRIHAVDQQLRRLVGTAAGAAPQLTCGEVGAERWRGHLGLLVQIRLIRSVQSCRDRAAGTVPIPASSPASVGIAIDAACGGSVRLRLEHRKGIRLYFPITAAPATIASCARSIPRP